MNRTINKVLIVLLNLVGAIAALGLIFFYHVVSSFLFVGVLTVTLPSEGDGYKDYLLALNEHQPLLILMLAGTWGAVIRHMLDNKGWIVLPYWETKAPAQARLRLNIAGDLLMGKATAVSFYALTILFGWVPEDHLTKLAVLILLGLAGGGFADEVITFSRGIIIGLVNRPSQKRD